MPPPIKQGKAKLPSLTGRLMVDTVNGKVRTRAWPKPRGPNVPPQVKIQNDRFRDAQKLAKLTDPGLVNRLREATRGSGLYPRDVLTKLMLAPPFDIEEYDGRKITHGRREVYRHVFDGFRLVLASNVTIPAATLTIPNWPMPVVDTAGFYDISNPSYITIPDHVDGMIFFGGWRAATIQNGFGTGFCRDKDAGDVIFSENAQYHTAGPAWCSGPVPVTPGQKFDSGFYCTPGATALAGRTFFSGIVISTDF